MSQARDYYLLPVKQPLLTQLLFAHVLLLLLSLPFDRMYSHLVMTSFALQIVLGWKTVRSGSIAWKKFSLPWKKTLLPAAVFFCTALGLLYSPQPAEGRRELLLQLPLLLLPWLLLLASPLIKLYRKTFLLAFSMLSAFTAVYLFANAVWTIRHFGLPLAALFSPAFTNHNFSEPVKMHATYLSMQWAIAFIFLLQEAARCRSPLIKKVQVILAIILLAGLLQLSSKSVAGALLGVVFIAWPVIRKDSVKRRRALGISIAVAAILVGIVAYKPAFRERYLTDLRTDFGRPAAGELAEPRVARWLAAWEAIRINPVLGQGAGSEKAMLHEIFYRKRYFNSFLNHLNAHSEYVSLLFKNGFSGLFIYLLVLGLGFREALRRKDLPFICFMVLVAAVSIGENMLDLDKGVYFYSLFFAFFLFLPESPTPTQPAGSLSRSYRERRSSSKPAVIAAIVAVNP